MQHDDDDGKTGIAEAWDDWKFERLMWSYEMAEAEIYRLRKSSRALFKKRCELDDEVAELRARFGAQQRGGVRSADGVCPGGLPLMAESLRLLGGGGG